MLKIVTYNIHGGIKSRQLINNIKLLAEQGVSIFCFQEVWKLENKSYIANQILEVLGNSWKVEYFVLEKTGVVGLGLCTIWNSNGLKLLQTDTALLPELKNETWWEKVYYKFAVAQIEKNSFIKALNPKARKPELMERGALINLFEIQGVEFRITNLHLDWAGGVNQRQLQLMKLTEYLASKPVSDKEIICGDFNSLGLPKNFNKRSNDFLKVLGNGFVDTLSPIKSTVPLFQRLDYIFQKGFVKYTCEVVNVSGSDHLPLKAILE